MGEHHSEIKQFKSIQALMDYLKLPAPKHPLFTLVDYRKSPLLSVESQQKLVLDFYKISFKSEFSGKIKYGQNFYDFAEVGLAFLKPGQIVSPNSDLKSYEGYVLYFHPDFIRKSPLGNAMREYGFFSYEVTEALYLSAKEKSIIQQLFETIQAELHENIDQFSQEVLVSQLTLLLKYSKRFYNRQFITRATANHQLIQALDEFLEDYFQNRNAFANGFPSVHFISNHLGVSQRYLSDLLRVLTGKTTQQYIQYHIIEKAKSLLGTSSLSISEIAYILGFEHPQSFTKLFKSKTKMTPSEYKSSV